MLCKAKVAVCCEIRGKVSRDIKRSSTSLDKTIRLNGLEERTVKEEKLINETHSSQFRKYS
jgi:hypothetical protein